MKLSIRQKAVAAAAAAALCMSACSSQPVHNAGPAATPMPLASPLAPGGDGLPKIKSVARWVPGGLTFVRNGSGAGPTWQLTGNGAPGTTADLFSAPIDVEGGSTYAFSMWVDPSRIIAGSVILGIYNPARNVAYGQVRIVAGKAARYSVTARIPAGVSRVVVDFQPNSCSVAAGRRLVIAQPAFGPAQR